MENLHLGILFILGLCVFGGLLGAWLFQKLHIPQVVGYIATGLLIGQSGLQLVSAKEVVALQPFNMFALGIIGFLVGGELKIQTFRRYAKQFLAILLGEGLGAFILVGLGSTALTYGVIHDFQVAVAVGIVFGAIASATDPASTIDVLWEYRAQGVLTTSVIAIVALDDALAMTLYGLGTGAAQMLAATGGSMLHEAGRIAWEIFGALAVGCVFALVLEWLLRWLRDSARNLAFAIGLLLLLISMSLATGMDVILATMAMGFTLINLAPRRTQELFELMRSFSTPIYVLFFVLVGARLSVGQMPPWVWGIVAIYVVGRSAGKMSGAYLGARITGSAPVVRRYMGLGLFAQGGVAIGLSIMATHHLGHLTLDGGLSIGDVIIAAVTATTLILQIAGPPLVKLAVKLADETGRKVTEEDVIASWKVQDAMDSDFLPLRQDQPLSQVVQILADNDYAAYPVVADGGQVLGTMALENLKEILADPRAWEWLLVADVMRPAPAGVSASEDLGAVIARMRQEKLAAVPVVQHDNGEKLVGMVSLNHVEAKVAKEMLRRQQPKHEQAALAAHAPSGAS